MNAKEKDVKDFLFSGLLLLLQTTAEVCYDR